MHERTVVHSHAMVVAKSSGEYQNNFCGFVVIRKKISSLKIYC